MARAKKQFLSRDTDLRFDFAPVTRGSQWFDSFQLLDGDDPATHVDLSALTIKMQVRKGCTLYLSAETGDDHITTSAFGTITIEFDATEMAVLEPGTYDIGLTVECDGVKEQEFIGSLPIVEGVAR